ncbi:MAG: STAS domain-containing protein [Clostridia bacterium]|nr:STAS domain-containing protein [Clostridia bacterium]
MTITENRNGDSLTIALEGRLETSTASELDAALQKVLPGLDELIFDFEKLDYVSSAGLRVLLSAHKALMGKKGMIIRNANELVLEVFEVTGFDSLLTIEK